MPMNHRCNRTVHMIMIVTVVVSNNCIIINMSVTAVVVDFIIVDSHVLQLLLSILFAVLHLSP